ncbi:hypothetical protein [Salinisphaera aquimarina]|uniref:Uncharacterized protein n=1 Tax=Salinisphaera aquimarina TaxID=2094031 RepID=A0ABV7EIP9_9GAMM
MSSAHVCERAFERRGRAVHAPRPSARPAPRARRIALDSASSPALLDEVS